MLRASDSLPFVVPPFIRQQFVPCIQRAIHGFNSSKAALAIAVTPVTSVSSMSG